MLQVLLTGSLDEDVLTGLRKRQLQTVAIDLKDLNRFTGGRAPDAIVIDTRSLGHLPPEIAGLRRQFPSAGLVILASALDPGQLRDAMRMGVNEWVAEPLDLDELVAAIDRVVKPLAAPAIGKIFAIVGAKGGLGSTTVAVNLATSMSLVTKQPTLLIDMHFAYGDAAVLLGVDPRFSVVDALENIERLDETYLRGLIVSTPSGVDLLASSHRIATTVFDVTRLRRLLDTASTMYRYIVLDCPRDVPAVLEAIDAAAQIVVVANQELPTLRSAARIVGSLRQRCGAERIKVAISRFDAQADIGRADVERVLGGAVHYQFPNDYRTSAAAIARGEPLIINNHSQLASSLGDCAQQLGGFTVAKAAVAKTGLFARLGVRR